MTGNTPARQSGWTELALMWIGTTLEISAGVAFASALFWGGRLADQVLMTLALILFFCGASLQLLSLEVKTFEKKS